MTASVRHSLVSAAVVASSIVVEKAAAANPDQLEVIQAVFPSDDKPMTKLAALSRVLATAQIVEDPEEAAA
jgi:hypothetical protein